MRINKKLLIGIIITALLLIGALVAYYLSQQRQDVRQRAAEPTAGKAASFDGQTSHIKIPAENVTLNEPPYTIEFFAKPDLKQKDEQILFTVGEQEFSPTCRGDISFYIQPYGDNLFRLNVIMRNQQDTASPIEFTSNDHSLSATEWSHIALTVSSEKANGTNAAQLFFNGRLVSSAALPTDTFLCINSDIFLGRANDTLDTDQPFSYNGLLDELRFSNTVRYTESFTPPTEPFSPDEETLSLWHFDGTATDEMTAVDAELTQVEFVDAPFPHSTTLPVCQADIATCEWDAVPNAVSYHYKITKHVPGGEPTPAPGADILVEGDVQAPTTSVTFTSEANRTYTCEVHAVNTCGPGDKGSATATCTVPTPTNTPTPTPTSTPTPTGTPPPTPTNTPTPTATGTPPPTPTPTGTPVPTNTPTATPIPPTATDIPTATPTTPPGQPSTPTPTLASPGPGATIIGIGAFFTILSIMGAVIFFAL